MSLIAVALLASGAFVVAMLFVRLRNEIKLNRKIERLSGNIADEEATRILKRMRDTTTEDTASADFPDAGEHPARAAAIRPQGRSDRIYRAGPDRGSRDCFLLEQSRPSSSIDAFEPIVNAIAIHFTLTFAVLAPIVRMRKSRLLMQLSALILHVSRSLQAGQTVDAALSLASKAIPNPLQREILDVVKLTAVGVTAPEALRAVSPNIDLAEYDFFTSAIEAADRSGGNLSRVLENWSASSAPAIS